MSGYEQGKTPEPPTPTVYESLLAEIDTLNRDFENLGTASGYDVGANPGNLPVINDQGKLVKLNQKKQTQFSQQARRIA